MNFRTFVAVGVALVLPIVAFAGPLDEPGYHPKVPLAGHPGMTYDLYLPRAYAERQAHAELRFPVVFLLNSGGSPPLVDWADAHKVLAWAETYRAIVIGVNKFFHPETSAGPRFNAPDRPGTDVMDAYMAVADRLPGAHPGVRLVVNTDPFTSARDWAVAERFPAKVGGFTFGPHNASSITRDEPLPMPPCAVAAFVVTADAYYRGRPSEGMPVYTEEELSYVSWRETVGRRLVERGVGFRTFENIDWNVGTAPLLRALTWMQDWAWVKGTRVNDAERRAAKASIARRLATAGEIRDPEERRAAVEDLLSIPGVDRTAEAKAAKDVWREAAVAAAATRTVPYFRHAYLLALARHPMMTGSPELAKVNGMAAALAKDPAVTGEQRALARMLDLHAEANGAFGNLAVSRDLLGRYEAVITDYPDTLCARTAKKQVQWLQRIIGEMEAAERRKLAPRAPLPR